MIDPIFWLGLSLFLVALSLTTVLIVAIPAIQELARAARSIEKLSDTLARELPPTLEAIRLTGLEITELTDDMTEGVKSAGNMAKQMDESFSEVRRQAESAQSKSRIVAAGVRAAWKTLTRPVPRPVPRKSTEKLGPGDRPLLNLGDRHLGDRSLSDRHLSDRGPTNRLPAPQAHPDNTQALPRPIDASYDTHSSVRDNMRDSNLVNQQSLEPLDLPETEILEEVALYDESNLERF